MRVKVVVFDYDGTLTPALHEDGTLSSKLAEIKEIGVILGIATGRSLESLRGNIGDKLDFFDFTIAENGAVIVSEKLGLREVFKPEYWDKVVERFVEEGLGYNIGEVRIGISEEDLEKARRVAEEFPGKVKIVKVTPDYFNAIPSNVNKARALLKVLERLGVEPAKVAFIGDGENDVEIAEICGFSAAVANASEKLKNKVKYVCKREDGEGVIEFLDFFMLRSIGEKVCKE